MGDELLLHYYYDSPYARKIIWALELKKIPYRAVLVSNVLPRPVTSAVTGGYRRIPILQIGADVYCDTALILDEIEKRFPEPSLRVNLPGGKLLEEAMDVWNGKFIFPPASSLLPFELLDPSFIEDRAKMSGHKINVQAAQAARPFFREQVPLASSKTGWLFDQPNATLADIHAAMCPWFMNKIVVTEKQAWMTAENFPHVVKWVKALDELTGGRRGTALATKMSEADALAIAKAKNGKTSAREGVIAPLKTTKGAFLEVKVGDIVSIVPEDYGKVPVVGGVVVVDEGRIAVRVNSGDVETVVHFPRKGYLVRPAKKAAKL
ncbi:hypothetical protein BC829DRAFT_406198 [Chytridium lagenaria]|nr:hypothetical protein BC829DRAFT_406198 [Chytridium lagenaria]